MTDVMTAMMQAHIAEGKRKMEALETMITALQTLRDNERVWCVEQLQRMIDPNDVVSALPTMPARVAIEERPNIQESMAELE